MQIPSEVEIKLASLTKNNLIILGAGASYGAGHAVFGWNENSPEKVPALGNNLFSDLQHFNPEGWGKLNNDMASAFRSDFEKGMQLLAEVNPHAMPPLQRTMAAYFFNFRPGLSNLYVRLAEKIKNSQWGGTIATLNYERLLEMSLLYIGLQPVCAQSINEFRQIELCYPHGCCHIFCESISGAVQDLSFSGTGVKTNGKISPVSDPNLFFQRISNDAFPPVMCYFDPKKAGGDEYNAWKDSKRKRNGDVVIYSYFKEAFQEICNYLSL